MYDGFRAHSASQRNEMSLRLENWAMNRATWTLKPHAGTHFSCHLNSKPQAETFKKREIHLLLSLFKICMNMRQSHLIFIHSPSRIQRFPCGPKFSIIDDWCLMPDAWCMLDGSWLMAKGGKGRLMVKNWKWKTQLINGLISYELIMGVSAPILCRQTRVN